MMALKRVSVSAAMGAWNDSRLELEVKTLEEHSSTKRAFGEDGSGLYELHTPAGDLSTRYRQFLLRILDDIRAIDYASN